MRKAAGNFVTNADDATTGVQIVEMSSLAVKAMRLQFDPSRGERGMPKTCAEGL